MSLARDPRFVGGRIGILSVLHTWSRAMVFHPHAHCLVPAGGLSQDGSQWRTAHKKYLVPVQALSILFRAKFIKLARKALPKVVLPESIWKKNWVVHCKPTLQGSQKVLGYLARYVHRIAITNNRILSVGDEKILFRYKDSRQLRWKFAIDSRKRGADLHPESGPNPGLGKFSFGRPPKPGPFSMSNSGFRASRWVWLRHVL